MSWRHQAACVGTPTNVFYGRGTPRPQAVATCARCPVRAHCLLDTIAHERDEGRYATGYRAGLSANARRRIYRKLNNPRPVEGAAA